jgi:oligopeptide transport system substrate-binding protein
MNANSMSYFSFLPAKKIASRIAPGYFLALLQTLLLVSLSTISQAAELPAWKERLAPIGNAWKNTEQRFEVNLGAEPQTLDPGLMTGLLEGRLAAALFEGLTSLDPETLIPRPGLATAWQVSDDGRTWTFFLRPDAVFSDGTPITAKTVRLSWLRNLHPKTASPYAEILFPLAGAAEFHRDEIGASEVKIATPDQHTLVVTLRAPTPYFAELCAFPTFMPVPMHAIQKHGNAWASAENLIGNGPFSIDHLAPGQYLALRPNPRYWDRYFVKAQQITYRFIENAETAHQLFQQGRLHWTPGVPLARVDDLKLNPDYYVSPFLGVYFYRFNTTKPPFDDPRVRQALHLAIDRETLCRDILRAGQLPATTFVPPGTSGYEPVRGMSFNVSTARDLLAAAGYGPGPEDKPFPEVELLYNTSENHKAVAEFVTESWRANLGIRVKPRNSEWKVYLDKMQRIDFALCRSAWIGDYNDPSTFLDLFLAGGGNNRTGWGNERYDELSLLAANATDAKQRLAFFNEQERLLVQNDFPITPLYFYVNQGMIVESFAGWYPNIRDQHPPKYWYREEF